jgi:hypothetical protein
MKNFVLPLFMLILSVFACCAINKQSSTNDQHAPNASIYANALIEFYGFDDNSDGDTQHDDTTAIAYPKNAGYPTLHNLATEGSGTYADPITFAADPKDLKGAFPIGSHIYVPFLQKYFIMEDECEACNQNLPNGVQYGLNLWMGPQRISSPSTLTACEDHLQRTTDIIIKPDLNLPVDTTPLLHNNQCTAQIH